ncbi:hypothetical protein PIB30_105601 [Stylosanthes scabra]|uniref:Aminotransferase-like plant mobile domain-containing protein n=1 Tax=Stylosanthes scabra TaxID=79078 RepID=A0ABU6VYU5_9FABA|nr:hypothetical protein [Stylosanthes scabra]
MKMVKQENGAAGKTTQPPAVLDILALPVPSPTRVWGGFLPASDEKGPKVLQMRHRLDMFRESDFIWVPYSALDVVGVVDPAILHERHMLVWRSVMALIYFGTIEWHQVDKVLPQFGGVQSRPRKALDLDFMHSKDGRGEDRWFPGKYSTWHKDWENWMAHVLVFPVHPHPGPDREFLDWWYELPHRFLSPEVLLADPRGGEVDEIVATRGTLVPTHRTHVPDVPDRSRPDRRRKVRTRMSQRCDGNGDSEERVRRA